MNRLEALGYWFSELAPSELPLPQRLVAPWPARDRGAVIAWLRAGKELVAYLGQSWCRFGCGERDMGCRDLTDGTFVWPEGLVHYVERHDVRLPERFVAHVLAHGGTMPRFVVPEPTFGRVDPAPWLAWGREQGACLDLAGWQRPTPEDARRIAADLAAARDARIVLFRTDPREVVLQSTAGALAVHRVTPSGHPVRHLAGWHEWPAAAPVARSG
ncbi:MAG: hypothetical protein WAT39_17460 [Planctomycetota bacterium]